MKQSARHIVAVNAAAVALLASSAAFATDPFAKGAGSVSAGTAVAGGFSVGSNGSSTSYATNSESAKATITAAKSYAPNYCNTNVSAAITGGTKTESSGMAYNVSSGSGSGGALSAGHADTAVKGQIGIHGVTSGFNGGGSGTQTDNVIKAGTNQGSYVNGQTVSGFEADVHYARSSGYTTAPAGIQAPARTGSVEVSGSNTGYASGANASGALDNMNAAGVANIGASGYFFGKTNLSGSTGSVSAP
jgi:hypothetical protein